MTAAIDTDQEVRLYRARQTPELVDVPEFDFLMIDGHGDPNVSGRYREAIQALYAVSYALRFSLKRAGGSDYKVSPLEGLWCVADMSHVTMEDKSAWDWTAMIKQPSELTSELVEEIAREVAEKKQLPAVAELRLERFAEGPSAQILHLGPYAEEGATIERLHAFIEERAYRKRGKHHEIYLGDPRRAAPERLKTIIRQPVTTPPTKSPRDI